MCLERKKKPANNKKKKIRKTTHLPKHINERRTRPTHTHTHNRQKQIYKTQTQHKHTYSDCSWLRFYFKLEFEAEGCG